MLPLAARLYVDALERFFEGSLADPGVIVDATEKWRTERMQLRPETLTQAKTHRKEVRTFPEPLASLNLTKSLSPPLGPLLSVVAQNRSGRHIGSVIWVTGQQHGRFL